MRRSPPPKRACSRSSRKCSILSCVVLAWMPRSVSLAIAGDLAQDLLGNRIGILLARGDLDKTLVPVGAGRELLQPTLDAIFDDGAYLAAGTVGAPLPPGAALFEMGTVFGDAIDQFNDAAAVFGHSLLDGRRPIVRLTKLEHGAQVSDQPVGAGQVSLVHDQDVGDF